MKKFVGLDGSLGSEITSEKYNVRLSVGVTEASPANRLPSVTPFADSVMGSPDEEVEAWMIARGRVGSLSPAGPVSMFCVWKTALWTAAVGAVTMNSARPAGGIRM